ncbi:hypothetical protein SAMD00019534_019490 [Acytostelium subglobosum LB1]|uniref:hypothetical protein n=1 Tax=Acytostelium subglobosum LB1 TaxID=1410327 RepID=UPI000644B54C|nr:hypothetical protein SAMD00019534_019490 [Acytostelium subglobosum LB1]GAM18774.1 hypothetical protein SAMD00019534_019490 [Acytostelium subglobosum LB1]|eukprot:XP_012757994.1 hypothetical protein SAMD00019534_019490 [Acytostelium subglobosum LB1]
MKGNCTKGHDCPYKHSKTEHAVVCKHWLRGLCKKGELCEFLHEYDLAKMPECYFFSKFGECSNQECMYLHLNPEEKVVECPWYARGFCKHGPKCRHKHMKKLLCENYYLGFCPEGPKCKYGHPKFELPKEESEYRQQDIEKQQQSQLQSQTQNQHILHQIKGSATPTPTSNGSTPMNTSTDSLPPGAGGANSGAAGAFVDKRNNNQMNKPYNKVPICHACGVSGHKSNACPNNPNPPPSLDTVTCYKCFQTGHYANKCTNKRTEPPPGFNLPPHPHTTNNNQQQNQFQGQGQGQQGQGHQQYQQQSYQQHQGQFQQQQAYQQQQYQH